MHESRLAIFSVATDHERDVIVGDPLQIALQQLDIPGVVVNHQHGERDGFHGSSLEVQAHQRYTAKWHGQFHSSVTYNHA